MSQVEMQFPEEGYTNDKYPNKYQSSLEKESWGEYQNESEGHPAEKSRNEAVLRWEKSQKKEKTVKAFEETTSNISEKSKEVLVESPKTKEKKPFDGLIDESLMNDLYSGKDEYWKPGS